MDYIYTSDIPELFIVINFLSFSVLQTYNAIINFFYMIYMQRCLFFKKEKTALNSNQTVYGASA